MKQARLVLRLWSLIIVYGIVWQIAGCQQTNALQGTIVKPNDDKQGDEDKGTDDDESERISPPHNIVGSYLVCQEQEQLNNLNQNAVIHCGVYMEPAHVVLPVARLDQWQLSGSTASLRSLAANTADQVELRFQSVDLAGLKDSVKRAKLHVRIDNGEIQEGFVSDLLPATSRLSTSGANQASAFAPLWNEGFEGTRLSGDSLLIHDVSTVAMSTTINWANPTTQTASCGKPLFELMHVATINGAIDSIGAGEGSQFIDTDSACWPTDATGPIYGPSNLTIGKDISLTPGHVYRVSFKVRQQPLPTNGFLVGQSALQVKINQTVVKDLRTFSDTWQEISFDWVAGTGISKIEWVDVGAADDSFGVLLDDLRIQIQNF